MSSASGGKREEHEENVVRMRLTLSPWTHIECDENQQVEARERENPTFCFLNYVALPQDVTPKELGDTDRT